MVRFLSGRRIPGLPALSLIVFTLNFTTACLNQDDSGDESGTRIDIIGRNPDSFVCDPFDGGSPSGERSQGVRGEIYYIPPGEPIYHTVGEYLDFGVNVSDFWIFIDQLYVPTRRFDLGFVTHGGQTLTIPDGTPEGTTLYEYFALNLEGRIQLGEGDAHGDYQFAVLADDGAVFEMDFGSGLEMVVDNDGTHGTRMKCAEHPVSMAAEDRVPFRMRYYQGPRFHIALILMWRPWPSNPEDVVDYYCGRTGNSLYFNYLNDPPTPQPAYEALLSRGWKPLNQTNYLVPEEEGENPCNAPAPIISRFGLVSATKTSLTVTWDTDIPATTQVLYTNSRTGESLASPADATLQTLHTVTMSDLDPNTSYSVRAVSASSSGRSTESQVLNFRTQR